MVARPAPLKSNAQPCSSAYLCLPQKVFPQRHTNPVSPTFLQHAAQRLGCAILAASGAAAEDDDDEAAASATTPSASARKTLAAGAAGGGGSHADRATGPDAVAAAEAPEPLPPTTLWRFL